MNANAELEIHPHASVYRMHTDDEMAALVESIKKNGLRDPILLDEKGRLIDGRNRLKACGIANIEPRFETFAGDDDAIADLIYDKNSVRRDLSTGQKAIAYALLYPEVTKLKRKNLIATNGEQNVPHQRISDARIVIQYAPGDIEAIKQGDENFTKIVAKAKEIKRQQEPTESRVEKLAKEDAHLASMVRQGDLSIEAAEAEVQVRKQRVQERRGKALELFRAALATLQNVSDPDFPAFIQENLTDPLFRAEVVKSLALDRDRVTAAKLSLPPAMQNLQKILQSIEEKF